MARWMSSITTRGRPPGALRASHTIGLGPKRRAAARVHETAQTLGLHGAPERGLARRPRTQNVVGATGPYPRCAQAATSSGIPTPDAAAFSLSSSEAIGAARLTSTRPDPGPRKQPPGYAMYV